MSEATTTTERAEEPEVTGQTAPPEVWLEALRRARGAYAPLLRGWVTDKAEAGALALQREDDFRAELPELGELPVDAKRAVYKAYALGWRSGRRHKRGGGPDVSRK
ncbi:MAG: hypothetical protein ACRDI2_26785 [Chloroflexota bacterium]